MFVGRKKEVEIISRLLNKPSGSLLIYGKRKVGKTTLLRTTLVKSKDTTIYYECIKSNLKDNLRGLIQELVSYKVLDAKISFETFIDLFSYLSSQNKRLNIIIDEYPYLKEFEKAKVVDSIFQKIIDNYLKNIRLFISGSHVGMMKELLAEKNALYGRFDYTINLKELDYIEAASFYAKKSVYDKIAFYAIFGGSPYINSYINEKESLKKNIVNLILRKESAVYSYVENLLMSDFTNVGNAERILSVLSNGKKKYSEIESVLSLNSNGLLSKQIDILLNMELIQKVYPINKKNDKKKAFYEIKDNIVRFYFAYIYKHKSSLETLGSEVFYDSYIKDSIITFISYRFEDIARCYLAKQIINKKIKGVTDIGTYYYDDKKNKTNGEFDIAIAKKNTYDIYEAKYYNKKMTKAEMNKELLQIKGIKDLKVENIGFLCTGGYEEMINGLKYINCAEIY